MSVKELKLTPSKSQIVFEQPVSTRRTNRARLVSIGIATAVLALCFCVPLYHLLRLAAADPLYSELPMVPLVSLYLIWLRRGRMPASFETGLLPAALFSSAGLLVLAAWWIPPHHTVPPIEDYLAANILALVLLFIGTTCLFLGKAFASAFACPIGLLFFTVPFPIAVRHWIETLLQHGSAVFAGLFFGIAGAPATRDGLVFQLSDIVIQVAPECSGIHSSLVLTIVSIAGAWLFLLSPWKRAVLVLAVIPLALIRNGFRIFVIGQLCMSYGPQMIDSPIHHRGGPLFFVLSLVPFFLLLLFLRKTERSKP